MSQDFETMSKLSSAMNQTNAWLGAQSEDWKEGFTSSDIMCVAFLVCCPLFTFFGQRFLKPVIATTAFGAGGYLGYLLALIMHSHSYVTLAFIIVGGGLAAFAAVKLERAGLFALGFCAGLLGATLGYNFISEAIGYDGVDLRFGLTTVCSLVLGYLVVYLEDPFEAVLTAICGSYMGMAGINYILWRRGAVTSAMLWPPVFFHNVDEFKCYGVECVSIMVSWLVLCLAGIYVQFKYMANNTEAALAEKAAKEKAAKAKGAKGEDVEVIVYEKLPDYQSTA